MRKTKYTSQFKRDYKREKRGTHRSELDNLLSEIINLLVKDSILPKSSHDHSLTGNWKGFRDCHIKPNLVLIYKKTEEDFLELIRLGSHSELGF
jgi:mRNA interferase YafQ